MAEFKFRRTSRKANGGMRKKTKKNKNRGKEFNDTSSANSSANSSTSSKSSSFGINQTWRDVKPNLKVRIKTEHNKIRSYSIDSAEKKEKIEALKRPNLKECTAELDFPCMFRGAVIENKEELAEFIEMNAHKSSKAVQKHLNEMRKKMFEEGTYAKRIPKEFRLYSHNTGNVYDIRDYFQSR